MLSPTRGWNNDESYPKLTGATALDDCILLLSFSNGEKKAFGFAPNLSHPCYEGLRDSALFRRVAATDGGIEWAMGQDCCPHTPYDKGVGYAGQA